MENKRKGIILSGGLGSRLYPNTSSVSKQLFPIHSKPTVYYPLSILMLAGIREICIITSQEHLPLFKKLLGNGTQWGCEFTYIPQTKPGGIAEAYLLAEDFLDGHASALILGDNVFLGTGLGEYLTNFSKLDANTIFMHPVVDPHRYGIAEINSNNEVLSIEEKPIKPKSNNAIVGLYFLDKNASEIGRTIQPSKRGELEIISILEVYLKMGKLNSILLPRGTSWFDTGTPSSLVEVSTYVRVLEERDGNLMCAPEEVAFLKKLISLEQFIAVVNAMPNSFYKDGLVKTISNLKK